MTNDQFERRMQFIVEHQAQFSADILELKETQKLEGQLWREKYDNLTDAITTIVGMVGKLTESEARLFAAQERTDEQLSELTNKQAETDDRLNTLIGVVERYFSGNGALPGKRKSKSGGERKPKKGTRR
jgi:hypothetical protein